MVLGKLGLALAIGMLVFLPVEKWQLAGLGPADAFIVLIIALAWLAFLRTGRMRIPGALGLWLIFVGGLIGALSGLNASVALLALLQEVYLVVMFVTFANAFSDEDTFLTFRKAWLIVAAVESFLLLLGGFGVVLPYLAGGGATKAAATSVGSAEAMLAESGRTLGTFVNANAAAGYMLVSFFILLSTPYPRNRLLRAGLIGLYLGGILSTGSNAGVVGVAAGLAVSMLYWQYQRGRAFLLTLGLGSLATAALILVLLSWSLILPVVTSTFGRPQRGDLLFAFSHIEEKLDKRSAIWGPGLEVFPKHPLGIGPNVSKTVVGIGMHNDYVAFLIERGPLGLIGLLLLIGQVLSWLGRAANDSTSWNHHWATGALLGGLVGVCALAAAHEVTHGRPVWLLFAMIFVHAGFLRSGIRPRTLPLPGRTGLSLARSPE